MTASIINTLRRARIGALAIALAIATAWATPANATIDNEATAGGTFGGNPVTSNTATQNVPVAAPSPTLTASKSFVSFDNNAVGDGDLQAGDQITYTIQVNNTGNVSLTNVIPVEDSITFGGVAGGGSFSFLPVSVASLAPGANTSFTATYTLTALDIYRGAAAGTNGTVNVGHGRGTFGGTDYDSATSQADTTLAADPELLIAKSYSITTDGGTIGQADVGDVITYTYTITNTGNVSIDDVTVSDVHEPLEAHEITLVSTVDMNNEALDGGSSDPLGVTADGAVDGSWDLLGPESIITFTYAHTVGQPEFESQ